MRAVASGCLLASLLAIACKDKTPDPPAPKELVEAPPHVPRLPTVLPREAPAPVIPHLPPTGEAASTLLPPQILPELGSFAFATAATRYEEDVPKGKWPSFSGLPKATNCPAFVAYTRRRDALLAGGAKANQEAFGFSLCRCTALEWLVSATAAKRSFIRDFALTPESVTSLPEAFATLWTSQNATRLEQRRGERFTWIGPYPNLSVKVESPTRILAVEDRDSQVRVAFWALADFDNNGTEDALFYVVNMARGHGAALHRLIAVTRDAANKPYRVVRQHPE